MKQNVSIRGRILLLLVGCAIFLSGSLVNSSPVKAQNGTPRINIPYTSVTTNLPVPDRAVFWLGQVGPTDSNYADVRVIYNDDNLYVTVHVFDRFVQYDTTPALADLTNWDAATLFLNLNSNTGNTPTSVSYKFVGQYNWHESRTNYQVAYQGNGTGWTETNLAFETSDGLQGIPNDSSEDRGWNITFKVSFASLGLSGPPAAGTVWGAALVLHDRDLNDPLPNKLWPSNLSTTVPATWGQFHFGLPSFSPPPVSPEGSITIRNGLDDVTVIDGQVGGDSVCAGSIHPNYWAQWGSLNYSTGAPSERFVIQNQWNLGDWPCFSKYFIDFPLDTVPANKKIISAELTLYQFGNSNQGGSFDPTNLPEPSVIQIFTVDEAWNEAR